MKRVFRKLQTGGHLRKFIAMVTTPNSLGCRQWLRTCEAIWTWAHTLRLSYTDPWFHCARPPGASRKRANPSLRKWRVHGLATVAKELVSRNPLEPGSLVWGSSGFVRRIWGNVAKSRSETPLNPGIEENSLLLPFRFPVRHLESGGRGRSS